MTLHLTPEMMAQTYELLRATPPFRGWKLPAADDVEFHVTRHTDRHGDCVDAGHAHVIRCSANKHGSLASLIITMAHEMCHVRQSKLAPRERDHGTAFKRMARSVCRIHGFDPKVF